LNEVGVDVVGLIDIADTIFESHDGDDAFGERQLTFGEFMEVILDMRGSKTARVKDIVNLRKHINFKFQRLETRLMDLDCLTRYQGTRSNLQEAALSGQRTARGAQESAWANDFRVNGTHSPAQSHVSGMTTVATFQNMVTESLRDLQASHERELAVLHTENLRLLDKLSDLGKAAGKSLAGVLEVAARVPETTDVTTLANSVASIGTAAIAAGPQPAAAPRTHVQMPLRDLSRVSSNSMEKFASARAANATPARSTSYLFTSGLSR